MGPTDEMLMAYADGQLDAAEAAEVERAMASDESLAERVALLADARTAVRRAYGTPPEVSASLEASVRAMVAADALRREGSNVVSLAARRRVVPFWQVPLAAMLALAVGAGSVWLAGRDQGAAPGLQLAGLTDPAVADALRSLPSGETATLEDGAQLVAVSTFPDAESQLCREFEHSRPDSTTIAVACRTDAEWTLRFAVAAPFGGEGYAPASSLEALDAFLSSANAGAPLSPEDEAAALAALD